MSQPQPSEKELLQSLLPPLLDDFQYWFSRSRSLLESEEITFLSQQRQSELLERLKQAQQEVNTAQMLFQATGSQVGLEVATLMPWHQLVGECWQVAMQWRSLKSESTEQQNSEDDQI
ncbi:MAG: DUF2605 domain-containing protein [Symploca sp. SIO2C1]|nr:DUF2605 domain-containing protein [Symploca sp. SIO2C1]